MVAAHGGHDAIEEHEQPESVWDDAIEASRGLVLRLAHEVDPEVRVTLEPYLWHGEPVLDIGLWIGHHSHHLQVSSDRLEHVIWKDHHVLEHDIQGAVLDLRRELAALADGSDEPEVASQAGLDTAITHDPVTAFDDPSYEASPPAVASGLPVRAHEPEPVGAGEIAAEGHAIAPMVTRDTPDTGHLPRHDPADPLDPKDRDLIERAIHLVHHIMDEIEPRATVHYEEYHWHGELTLDIAISLEGHMHHYEVTVERAALFLRDHHMLEHDLEGVLTELHREIAAHGPGTGVDPAAVTTGESATDHGGHH